MRNGRRTIAKGVDAGCLRIALWVGSILVFTIIPELNPIDRFVNTRHLLSYILLRPLRHDLGYGAEDVLKSSSSWFHGSMDTEMVKDRGSSRIGV